MTSEHPAPGMPLVAARVSRRRLVPDSRYTNTFELQRTERTNASLYAVWESSGGYFGPPPSAISRVFTTDGAVLWDSNWTASYQREGVGRMTNELLSLQSVNETQQYVEGGSTVGLGALLVAVAAFGIRFALSAADDAAIGDENAKSAHSAGFGVAAVCVIAFVVGLFAKAPEAIGKLLNAPYYAAKEFAALKKD
jgi:hypothetical protein